MDEFIEQFSEEVSDLKKNEKVTGLKHKYGRIKRNCHALQEELRWELGNIFEGYKFGMKTSDTQPEDVSLVTTTSPILLEVKLQAL